MRRRQHRRFAAAAMLAALMTVGSCSSAGSRPASEGSTPAASAETPRAAIARIAARIRRADYEGDRPQLAKLYEEMAPYTQGPLASRAHYWRGFAMWRRAFSGFNDKAEPAELAEDLKRGIEEFDAASAADPRFADAKIGAASCWVNLSFLRAGTERTQGYAKHTELLGEARGAEPANPRLAWVLGATQYYTPPQYGGGQTKAIETYEAGLVSARQERVTDDLNPSWGQPELLMNLAFANLNRSQPDLAAADRYARAAWKLVPYWHYVRDVLIPQIRAAQAAAASSPK
jgi:hypothetical protein